MKGTLLKYWEIGERLKSDIWSKWYALQLQSLQQRGKWHASQRNLEPDDIVLLKEVDPNRNHWPLAPVMETYPGPDGFVRVVKVWCNGHEYRRAVQKLIPLMRRDGQSPTSFPGSVSRPKSLD